MVYTCAYRGCSSRTGEQVSLFRFPKDYESAKVWIEACNRRDLLAKILVVYKNYRLCEHHFEDKYISKGSEKKTLFPNAVPTKFPNLFKRLKQLDEGVPEEPPINIIILTGGSPSGGVCLSPSVLPHEDVKGPSTSKGVGLRKSIVRRRVVKGGKHIVPLPSRTCSTQTDSSRRKPQKQKISAQVRKLRKANLKRKLKDDKQWTYECLNKMCDIFLRRPVSDTFKTHAALKDKTFIPSKQFALTLYFLNPKAYRYFEKLMTLPTKNSLKRFTQQIFCRSGLENPDIFKTLEIKIKTMSEQDKHCMLCIDKMLLKSTLYFDTGRDEVIGFEDTGDGMKEANICKNVLVIMAKGLYSPWEQAIGYFFVGSQLQTKNLYSIMAKCVLKLSEIGLFVEGIVSNTGSSFIKLAELLGVTPENTEFELEGKKLVYIFDPCHLIKATRNSLLKHSFHFRDKKTSWSFVKYFYEQDKKQIYRYAPKISDSHINPSKSEKMEVSLAAQVLSHTVACGMNTYLSLNALPADSIGTIQAIEMFNNLFDILNSCSLGHSNKYKNVFDGSKFQTDFFADVITFLKELKIFNQGGQDITKRVKFHKCWIVTINSVLKLWEKISKLNFQYLKIRRLNKNCIENFFVNMRQQNRNNINPTSIQFQRAFRKMFCQNYFQSNHNNCGDDLDDILKRFTNVTETVICKEDVKLAKALVLPDYSYRDEYIPTQTAFSYICGYLLKKALEIHTCVLCHSFVILCEELNINNLLVDFKDITNNSNIYAHQKSSLEGFINFIYKLECTFNSRFEETCTGHRVSNTLLNLMENIQCIHPCAEFPTIFVKKLFIRMKIFYTLKYINRDLSRKRYKKERKLKILSYL